MMSFRSKIFLFLLLSLPLWSASQEIIKGKPPELLVIHPETIPAGKPDIVKLTPPKVVPAYSNTFPAKAPRICPFIKPTPIPIGKPKVFDAKPRFYFLQKPQPVEVGKWQFKDDAIYNISYLDVDQGISSSYTGSQVMDKSGNIWWSTSGTGINMFDGKNIYNYTDKDGLGTNYMGGLFVDSKGNIWMLFGQNGVGYYDGKKLVRFTKENGFPSLGTKCVTEDPAGNIIIGLGDGGYIIYDWKKFYKYDTDAGFPLKELNFIFYDSRGDLWFGAYNGLVKVSGGNYYYFGKEQGLRSLMVQSIGEAGDGKIWFGQDMNGIYCYDGKEEMKNYTTNEGLLSDRISAIHFDKDKLMWMTTADKGFCIFDGYQFYYFRLAEGVAQRITGSILEDQKGNMWISTFGGGMMRFNFKPFTNLSMKENFNTNNMVSFAEGYDGKKWYGANDFGVMWSEGDKNYFSRDTVHGTSNCIRNMIPDKDGSVWLGTWGGGLVNFDGKTKTIYKTKQGLNADAVLGLAMDKSGKLWMGHEGNGVTVFDGKNMIRIGKDQGFPATSAWEVYADKEGIIWIGTSKKGLIRFDGKDFYRFGPEQGLLDFPVLDVFEDSKKRIWMATNGGGVNMFTPANDPKVGNIFTHFSLADGLASEKVWSVIEDKKGRIWASTERGVASITEQADGKFSIVAYDKSDGVKGLDYYAHSVYIDSIGQIEWGSGKCIVKYDPTAEIKKMPAPGVNITGININGQNIKWNKISFIESTDSIRIGAATIFSIRDLPADTSFQTRNGITYDDVSRFFNLPQHLVLPYDMNRITFSFTGTDWGDEEKIKFKYILEGFENKWNTMTLKTEADYRNLPYGNFTFKVISVSRFGPESEVATFSFTVLPPWWKTWWFIIIEFAVAGLLLMVFIKFRERTLRERNLKLESTVSERTAEVVSQKIIVEQKNKDITDSINYARRIQSSILVPYSDIQKKLPASFILYKPKDIVSGDFYFYAESDGRIIIAAVDCTGHGVPGAFMSMVGNEMLENIVIRQKITDTSKILTELHKTILISMNRDTSSEKSKDGMDVAILSIDMKKRSVQFSGASRNLYYFNSKGFNEVRGERWSIGGVKDVDVPYESKTIELTEPSTFYIFSDGFADQFGSAEGKKLMTKNFKRLLADAQNIPVTEQGKFLDEKLKTWMGTHEQVDDILVIGVKL